MKPNIRRSILAAVLACISVAILMILCVCFDTMPPLWAVFMFYFIIGEMEKSKLENEKYGEK